MCPIALPQNLLQVIVPTNNSKKRFYVGMFRDIYCSTTIVRALSSVRVQVWKTGRKTASPPNSEGRKLLTIHVFLIYFILFLRYLLFSDKLPKNSNLRCIRGDIQCTSPNLKKMRWVQHGEIE